MRQLTLFALFLAPIPALAQSAPATPAEAAAATAKAEDSKNFVRFAMNFYGQQDGGGNPDVDEKMQVYEPQLMIGVALTDRLSVTLGAHGGVVSAASTNSGARGGSATAAPAGRREGGEDGEHEDEDDGAVTGASTGSESETSPTRGDPFFGVEATAFYAWSDEFATGVGVTYGQEPTYRSIGVNARVVVTSPDRNDTFTAHVSATFDTVDIRLFDGTGQGAASRNTFSAGAGWTHVLTPRTVTELSYDVTYQRGILQTPYNSVRVAGTEVTEELPSTRLRHAIYGRFRHLLFDEVAVEPGCVLYADSWGILAASPEVRVSWEVVPNTLIVQPWYRFHVQNEVAWFTDRSEPTVPRYRTQDSDLGSFTSHTAGLKFVLPDIRVFGLSTELEFGGDYTFRSTRLNGFSLTAGLLVRF